MGVWHCALPLRQRHRTFARAVRTPLPSGEAITIFQMARLRSDLELVVSSYKRMTWLKPWANSCLYHKGHCVTPSNCASAHIHTAIAGDLLDQGAARVARVLRAQRFVCFQTLGAIAYLSMHITTRYDTLAKRTVRAGPRTIVRILFREWRPRQPLDPKHVAV